MKLFYKQLILKPKPLMITLFFLKKIHTYCFYDDKLYKIQDLTNDIRTKCLVHIIIKLWSSEFYQFYLTNLKIFFLELITIFYFCYKNQNYLAKKFEKKI